MAVPSAPVDIQVSFQTFTSAILTVIDGSNGGQAIDAHNIVYGRVPDVNSPSNAYMILSNPNTNVLTINSGLVANATYYAWARTRNATGWGAWSAGITFIAAPYPNPPSAPSFAGGRSNTTAWANFTDPSYTGDAAIDLRQIFRSTNPSGPPGSAVGAPTLPLLLTGLTSGATYYFWGRVRNANGRYSDYSARSAGVVMPSFPASPSYLNVKYLPDTLGALVEFIAGSPGSQVILEHQVGWGLDPTTPEHLVNIAASSNPKTVFQTAMYDLLPGRNYYFWAWSRNTSEWSWNRAGPFTLRVPAGAKVKSGSTYKWAVPYVKVNGVWRRVRPFVKSAGVWKDVM